MTKIPVTALGSTCPKLALPGIARYEIPKAGIAAEAFFDKRVGCF
jgi:hypothetical protein